MHRAARIAACGHGGQVLVSASTAALAGHGRAARPRRAPAEGPVRARAHLPARRRRLPAARRASTRRTCRSRPRRSWAASRSCARCSGCSSREDVRLLTLTGPGGTGKTRLALQAAAELGARYPHGVWWVPLAPLRDPELVLETAGQALGAKDGLAEHIADRSLLLLFDNFEQVVEAAADVAGLLAACPNLDLLVTSREPLHVTGEQEYPVPPLVHEEGVGLFLARARAVEPGFQADDAVSEICRRLDDLPLALELAAARVKALSPAQILERLEQRLPLLTGGASDLPERQRTLRATIEWSYDLLTPRSSASSPASPSSAAAARSRPPRRSRTPTSTPSSRSSTRASSATRDEPLLDAGDDPRVRGRAARGLGRGRGAAAPPRGALPGARRGGGAEPARARAPGSGSTGWSASTTTSAPRSTGSRRRARASLPCGWQEQCRSSGRSGAT